jgi:spermidine dehydrogenase
MDEPSPPPFEPRAPLDAEERSLGMTLGITRRDFLGSAALGSGAALLGAVCPAHRGDAVEPAPAEASGAEWTGYPGVGDYARSNGNTWNVVAGGHGLRDGVWRQPGKAAAATGESYDVVIVGGGFAGISAAYFLNKQSKGRRRCLILDNHEMPGGEAKRNELVINGVRLFAPQGSNDTDLRGTTAGWVGEMWRDLGLPMEVEYGRLGPHRRPMVFATDNYIYQLWADDFENHGFFFDEPQPHWVTNPWGHRLEGTPWSAEVRRDFLRWRHEPARPFKGSAEQMVRWLDTMTYEQYLTSVRGLGLEVVRYADPLLASAAGLGCDVMSAYAAYYDELPGFTGLGATNTLLTFTEKLAEVKAIHSFPGGNDAILRCFVKALIPDAIEGGRAFAQVHNGAYRFDALDRPDQPVRIRVGSTVVALENAAQTSGKPVTVTYVSNGRLLSVEARSAVMASASWTSRRILSGLPDTYREALSNFPRSPMLVVNVGLTNWRFLYNLGYTACSWRGGFGFTANIRPNMYIGSYRPPLDPDQPNVMTFYVPHSERGLPLEQQGPAARTRMLATSYRDYERQIRAQMVKLFGSAGFDPARDIAAVILNRWGHAYVNAGPGFYYGKDGKPAPRDILRQSVGRLTFAHSEFEGNQNWPAANREGRRAAEQIEKILERGA